MSKVDDNKKQKESTLLETAFHLFAGKGFAIPIGADFISVSSDGGNQNSAAVFLDFILNDFRSFYAVSILAK